MIKESSLYMYAFKIIQYILAYFYMYNKFGYHCSFKERLLLDKLNVK